jgi:hypothetical protein
MNTATRILIVTGAAAVGAAIALGLYDLLAPKYGIILHASDQDINSDKWKEIVRVLNLHSTTPDADSRDKLYRVHRFEGNGPVDGDDEGTLPEEELLLEKRDIIASLPKGFVGHAFQIGVGGKEMSKEIPEGTNMSRMPTAHFRPNMKESKVMVKEVEDALKR